MKTHFSQARATAFITKRRVICLSVLIAAIACLSIARTVPASYVDVAGRQWAITLDIPTDATTVNVDFAKWVDEISGISPGSNIQFFCPQSVNAADDDHVITINNSSGYVGRLTLVTRTDTEIRVIVRAFQFLDADAAVSQRRSSTWSCAAADNNPNLYTCTTSMSVTPQPVDGRCGAASQSYPSDSTEYVEGDFCADGTLEGPAPAFPTPGSPVDWTCNGAYGGESVTCTASLEATTVNGSCGPGATSYAYDAQGFTGDLCESGTADPTDLAFPTQGNSVSWVCRGKDGGTDSANCEASVSAAPTALTTPAEEADQEATEPADTSTQEASESSETTVTTTDETNTIATVEKTAIQAVITEAQSKVQEDYTPDSWTSLQASLASAIEVTNDTTATQTDVDDTATKLTKAIAGLVPQDATAPTVESESTANPVEQLPSAILNGSMKFVMWLSSKFASLHQFVQLG